MTTYVDDSVTSPLSLGDAVELGHALVQYVADADDIRVLFIKGPVADARGVRPPRVSADIDVLVPASETQALLRSLSSRGWVSRPESFAHSAFVTHSITLLHEEWPCDIDLHVSYPGFLADADVVFEALWARREALNLAGKNVNAPDFVGSVVIAALHSLRSPFIERHQKELSDAVSAVLSRHDSEQITDEIVALASTTEARHTLGPFLAELGHIETEDAPSTREYFEWRQNARQLNRSAQWIRTLLNASPSAAPRILRQAIFPSTSDFLTDHPDTSPTPRGLFFGRVARLIDGARAFPVALETIIEERRALRQLTIDPSSREDSRGNRRPPVFSSPAPFEFSTSPQEDEQLVGKASPVSPAFSDSLYRQAPAVAEVEHDDRVVLLDLARSRANPLVLSSSAANVWSALWRPLRLADLISDLAEQYGVDEVAISRDVEAFLEHLVGLGIVTAATRPPEPDASDTDTDTDTDTDDHRPSDPDEQPAAGVATVER
ncbi:MULTISPECIES: PqqD family peptide modification chaperone [unclassified Rathayibacter]|uniref:PqqD family peptide modification chaperone n=1 Tax=unclassified Rathayibacter TaxID=2609250 RepID=UPI00188BF0FE|nr:MULTISPECIES: PqqD family peptide modification chaperone [unclassified Rathayibacter]MBF4463519.1 PqqD family peptide modification chaperone [Rathayibacter sp. VKM Ac-2879]MBF4504759.1 PqqD family peptide modification chaperone [Rathayibacter sp. VKM Ac-2878]